MKQLFISILCAGILCAFAGCSQPDTPSSSSAGESSAPPAEQSSATTPQEPAEESADVALSDIVDAIAAAYGDDYPAGGEIPPEVLELEFGLSPELYTEISAQMAMISVHNDRVVVAKAAPGKADELEQILEQAREKKIADTLQYPANIAKTNAAKVVRNGDYVAFLLVGAPLDDSVEDATGEQAAQHAEQEVQKAVNAFYSAFA